MMDPFPGEWELLSLFEAEPKVLDPDVPWKYNCLRFESTRGSDRVCCVIEPGYECLEFSWWNRDTKHIELKLKWVSGLTISTGGGSNFMIATFRDHHLLELRIQLKPQIQFEWGTNDELP